MKKLFFLCCLLVLSGCSTQPTEDAPQIGWETLDAGDFTILAPSGWEFIPQMGIDSTVGKFSNNEMTLIFDYGMYTGDFANNSVYFEDPSVYTVAEETIDGLSAKIYVPVEASTDKPTVLFIENPAGTGENFEIFGDNLTEEQVSLAIQIFRTVDFK